MSQPTLSPQRLKLLDAACDIIDHPETPEQEKAFLARQLVQVTLPHRSPGHVPVWKRTNGRLSLAIRPGWDHKKDQSLGYPFGTIPRLLLFWINTEALRTKSRKLELGNSLAAFMRDLGLDPNTGRGKRSDAKRLRDQMRRLFKATISFEVSEGQHEAWLDMQVAPMGELWWDPKEPEQSSLFGSWIELGEKFYQAIIQSPVPIDMRALRALKRSPLALDLYAWATYRIFTVNKKGKSQFIPWRALMKQLGADYGDLQNFRRKMKDTLRKVQLVYPSLNFEYTQGGFILKPSRLAIVSRHPKSVEKPVN